MHEPVIENDAIVHNDEEINWSKIKIKPIYKLEGKNRKLHVEEY